LTPQQFLAMEFPDFAEVRTVLMDFMTDGQQAVR
jgi:hypothetical protein